MEILRDVSIDWLGKKWYFLGISGILLVIGLAGYLVRGGLAYGIDFTGGTIIYLKFNKTPDFDLIRKALKPESVGATIIQSYDDPSKNSVQVRMQTVFSSSQDVDAGHKAVQALLLQTFDAANLNTKKINFNNIGQKSLAEYFLKADPDNLKSQNKTTEETNNHYNSVTSSLLDYRTRAGEGLINSLEELKNAPGISTGVMESLRKGFYTGPFVVKGVESVGAVVGADLRRRAGLAVGLSFVGMLVYIGIRFKPIYGVAAIIAVIHDVCVTVGLLALTQKEVSLTVIAALLTLVGYSVNDTIVIFDRVRENLRLMRKETLTRVLNISVNQTMARTILTSGTTFLSVLALLLFGGEVLNGFAFVLTVGILVGTFSTLSIAAPIVEFWYRSVEQKSRRKAA